MICRYFLSVIFQVEELISNLPSLTVFDEFVLKACGFYCLSQCRYGFPTLILNQWRNFCIEPPDVVSISFNGTVQEFVFELPSDANSTQYVMVRNHCSIEVFVFNMNLAFLVFLYIEGFKMFQQKTKLPPMGLELTTPTITGIEFYC